MVHRGGEKGRGREEKDPFQEKKLKVPVAISSIEEGKGGTRRN